MHPRIRISTKRWQPIVAALIWATAFVAFGAETDNEPPLKIPQANQEVKPLFVPVEYPMPGAATGPEADNEPPLKMQQADKEPKPQLAPAEHSKPVIAPAGSYLMRCWQRGQLLFTENNLSDPVISALSGRVATFNEKSGKTAYLVEVADSLCLIKRR